jgi:hypothetical protein
MKHQSIFAPHMATPKLPGELVLFRDEVVGRFPLERHVFEYSAMERHMHKKIDLMIQDKTVHDLQPFYFTYLSHKIYRSVGRPAGRFSKYFPNSLYTKEKLLIEEKVRDYDTYPVIRRGTRSANRGGQIGNRASGGSVSFTIPVFRDEG